MEKIRAKSTRSDWKTLFSKSTSVSSNSVRFLLLAILPIAAYYQDFIQIFYLALAEPEIQYALLVPFIALYFFYKRRKAFSIPRKESWLQDIIGISLCLLALVTYVWGSYSFYPLQLHLMSLPIFLSGIILLIFGADVLRILIFPILLLFFLSPFPLVFSDTFGGYLIDSVATLAASILRIFFSIELTYRPLAIISTYTGTSQKMSFEIGEACSGIYSLTALGFFAVVVIYISSGSAVKKAAFGTLSLLTAYMLNVLRIVLTVTLGYFLGHGLAVNFFHLFGGVVILFFGSLLLLYASDKLLKLSLFRAKPPTNCSDCNKYENICYKCGRIIKLPKISIQWKHFAIAIAFLLVVTNLILQASAVNYNKVTSDINAALDLNPQTGKTTVFSNLSGWSVAFLGREYEAETRLGLHFVGDYLLYRTDRPEEIGAILELSDAQSKFHIWEGCLNYQTFDINIERTSYSTVFEENNVIVIADTIIADAPAYKQKIIVVSWFDSLNLRMNGTTTIMAVKVSLLQYVYNPDNQSTAIQVEATSNELLALGKEIEKTWSIYKIAPSSFVVDLYRNKETSMAVVVGMLLASTIFLYAESLFKKSCISKRIAQLPTKDLNLIEGLRSKKPSTSKKIEKKKKANDNLESPNVERLRKEGILQEKIVIRDGQLYVKWSIVE